MYPKLTKLNDLDGESSFSARGWKLNMYKISEGSLRYSKSILDLSDEISVEEVYLTEGSWRVRGTLDRNRLYIGIYNGLNIYRTNKFIRPKKIATMSFDGSEWDMLADAPVTGVSVSFGPNLVNLILNSDQKEILSSSLSNQNLKKCITLQITKNIELFERFLKWIMFSVQDKNILNNSDVFLNQLIPDLLASTRDLFGDLSEFNHSSNQSIEENKILLAKRIESLFWSDRDLINFDPFSLDELTSNLTVSRRSIQLAIEKSFNTNFTEFSRVVRLHKANREIQTRPNISVTEVALKYGFDHLGRFSDYYKRFFGSLPSEHKKN